MAEKLGRVVQGAMNRIMAASNADQVAEKIESDEFIHKEKCGCGLPIHTFRIPGEQLEGRLRPCRTWNRADRAKTAELWWPAPDGKEQGVAFRLTKMLWQAVLKDSLFGRWVRITYKGSIREKHLQYATKVYLVEYDKNEAITESFERVQTNGDKKSRKHRQKKPIHRPAAAAVA